MNSTEISGCILIASLVSAVIGAVVLWGVGGGLVMVGLMGWWGELRTS
ncbi:MAG: hypothetical protein V3S98_07915 [Dehalococcoidia bacterium]